MTIETAQTILKAIVDNISSVVIGKKETSELILMSLLANGHVLIEDVPGVGKTSLAYALAHSVDCSFRRIQFTPDILPSDITGFSIFNQKLSEFEYREGLVAASFILADEINRTSPKTQSSLLEVMEEKQVTVEGVTRPVPPPFMVIATQNPHEYLGTYPLPEAQMDRFLMAVSLGYPSYDHEIDMMRKHRKAGLTKSIKPVSTGEEIIEIQKLTEAVYVQNSLDHYALSIVSETRRHKSVQLGTSPRGSLALLRAAQACALYNNRPYVLPDDIKYVAPAVLSHRITLTQEARLQKIRTADIINGIINTVEVPIVRSYEE